jgi:hypothetical protein
MFDATQLALAFNNPIIQDTRGHKQLIIDVCKHGTTHKFRYKVPCDQLKAELHTKMESLAVAAKNSNDADALIDSIPEFDDQSGVLQSLLYSLQRGERR